MTWCPESKIRDTHFAPEGHGLCLLSLRHKHRDHSRVSVGPWKARAVRAGGWDSVLRSQLLLGCSSWKCPAPGTRLPQRGTSSSSTALVSGITGHQQLCWAASDPEKHVPSTLSGNLTHCPYTKKRSDVVLVTAPNMICDFSLFNYIHHTVTF